MSAVRQTMPASQPDPARPFIALDGVSKVFETPGGRVTAIEAASLGIAAGETMALIGPSGCGKSTLLMMVAGLLSPSGGRLTIGDQPVTAPHPDLAVVFQRDLLFDWQTVLGNVLSPFVLRGEPVQAHVDRARRLLDHVGLAGFEDRRPYELSGGMRQRVALCRALIQDPSILLLDEPFAALDALTREQMQLDLQRIAMEATRTTILVTHDIAEAVFMADSVVVMTARPSQIREVIRIDLPRPRTVQTRNHPDFGRHVAEIHDLFTRLGVLHG
jgi:NitT/TauT family transport system ATP-binding protein